MDVVVPLGRNERRDHWELKYLLRSLEKNMPDLGQVWVVGYKPSWATNIQWVPAEDSYPVNKDGNIINKIYEVCNQSKLSSHFLRCSDDQLLLKPLPKDYGNHFDLKPLIIPLQSKWYKRLAATQSYCRKKGWKSYNFDCHIPTIVDKGCFLAFMGDKEIHKELGMTINTLYFNQLYSRTSTLIPIKLLTEGVRADFTITIKDPLKVKAMLDANLIAGYADYGMTIPFVDQIKSLFPNKSKFEL